MTALAFSCDCGKVSGHVRDTQSMGVRIECFCDSYRATANLWAPKRDRSAPVPLFLSTRDKYEIAGVEHLSPHVFASKSILRWRATCCGVRMFSTQASAEFPIVSIALERAQNVDMLGPVKSRCFVPKPNGKAGQENVVPLLMLVAKAIGKRLAGRWRDTPFYDTATLKPVKEPVLISDAEKAAALA